MPAEPILSATRPPFPAYLLPSLSFLSPFTPLQRRPSSTASVSSISSAYSLSSATSSISSANTSPGTSPPQPTYFGQKVRSGQRYTTALAIPEQSDVEGLEEARAPRLGRVQPDTLKCSSCATDLAFASQIVSKGFTGRHGRAYLVSAPLPSQFPTTSRGGKGKESEKDKLRDLVNTKVGRPVSRQLVTGAHVVADINCKVCDSVVGWKYVDAKEPAQRYKIGKFILETRKLVGGKAWEDVGGATDGEEYIMAGEGGRGQRDAGEEEIEFDSEDEDECEDLFAGTWDAEAVRQRRERRFQPRSKTSEAKLGTSF